MKTKLFHYHVDEHTTPQDAVVLASAVVRNRKCDALFVDQFTYDTFVERLNELNALDNTICQRNPDIAIAGCPVETVPVVASSLIAKLEGHKRVAIITAI